MIAPRPSARTMMGGLLVLLLATVVLTAGCQATRGAGGAGMEKGGAELWAESCERCHNIRSPSDYTDAEWQVAMHHMRVRANLTPDESTKILEFLESGN